MSTPARTLAPMGAATLIACMALVGCDREPTPKMGSADSSLSTSTPMAQADTGTPMGSGMNGTSEQMSVPTAPLGRSDGPGLTMGQASADGSAFDAMTRSEPTGAGVPTSQQAATPAKASASGTLSSMERDFIVQTGAKSLFEIRVSELAAEKASDPALKSYAAMVAADHKGVSEEAKRLAAGHGVNLSQTLSAQDQKTLSALQNASGAAFDKQYLQTVGVTEHEKIIATYEKVGADAQNPALKDYVQSTLPTLKSHLDAARKLQTRG